MLLSKSLLNLIVLALAGGMTAGCTMYRATPLATAPNAPADATRITVDPASMRFPALASHRFDPSDGLDMTEVEMLAVANNPDLKLARDDLGIARAQSFAAGLLPDPQLGISSDYASPGAPGATRAFNYGLSMDLMAIVSAPFAKSVAQHNVDKLDLGLLWQETQTIAQARRLFVKVRMQDALLPLALEAQTLTQSRYDAYRQATAQGDMTSDVLSAALVAAQDAHKQYDDLTHADLQAHADLNALLGLSAQASPLLVGDDSVAPMSDTAFDEARRHLPERRADLRALAQGYAAQDAQYRQAILKQFPSLTVGFVRARDTSNVYTSGFQINLSLPIFNRNQGNVAIESATRQRLRDEYAIRLNQADADMQRLRADRAISAQQWQRAEDVLPMLADTSAAARRAYAAHDLTLGAYTDSRLVWLGKAIEATTLREALAEQDITLETLAGITMSPDMPDVAAHDLSMDVHHESSK